MMMMMAGRFVSIKPIARYPRMEKNSLLRLFDRVQELGSILHQCYCD